MEEASLQPCLYQEPYKYYTSSTTSITMSLGRPGHIMLHKHNNRINICTAGESPIDDRSNCPSFWNAGWYHLPLVLSQIGEAFRHKMFSLDTTSHQTSGRKSWRNIVTEDAFNPLIPCRFFFSLKKSLVVWFADAGMMQGTFLCQFWQPARGQLTWERHLDVFHTSQTTGRTVWMETRHSWD